ncbi:MAG: ferrous iron transport protein A [Candidatus Omnitrophota bacterium]|nr:ferrous iron transport protein A [Candidatus Omnitrophota bacterium]
MNNNMNMPIIPLTAVSCGKKVRIVSIVGGRGAREHLADIGVDIGSEIEILKRGAPGPFLIAAKEVRLAIGQGMAQKIMVSAGEAEGDTRSELK